jgi:hypothetical protein
MLLGPWPPTPLRSPFLFLRLAGRALHTCRNIDQESAPPPPFDSSLLLEAFNSLGHFDKHLNKCTLFHFEHLSICFGQVPAKRKHLMRFCFNRQSDATIEPKFLECG